MTSLVFAEVAGPGDFVAARSQMAFSLGWHIIIACLGVGFPALVLFAEWRGIRTGEVGYRLLARRWARAMGVLFAVGAVSGTILSFEMGILWLGLMQRYGGVCGFPFTTEGFAFFIEAIFFGDLPLRLRPVAAAGAPGLWVADRGSRGGVGVLRRRGQRLDEHSPRVSAGGRAGGRPGPVGGDVHPGHRPGATHMILAAMMVIGFAAAAVCAVAMLRGRRDRYHRLGLLLPLTRRRCFSGRPTARAAGGATAHLKRVAARRGLMA